MCCEVSYLYIGLLTQLSYLTYMGFLNSHHYIYNTIHASGHITVTDGVTDFD